MLRVGGGDMVKAIKTWLNSRRNRKMITKLNKLAKFENIKFK